MKLSSNERAALRNIAAGTETSEGRCGVTPSLWAAAKAMQRRGFVVVAGMDSAGHPLYSVTPKGRTALEASP